MENITEPEERTNQTKELSTVTIQMAPDMVDLNEQHRSITSRQTNTMVMSLGLI